MANKILEEVSFEDAVDGEEYLTEMKYGWIMGVWNSTEQSCHGYYWRDMEWWPHKLYQIVDVREYEEVA